MLKSALLRTLRTILKTMPPKTENFPRCYSSCCLKRGFLGYFRVYSRKCALYIRNKAKVLEETNPLKRLEYVIAQLKAETELLKLEHEIERKVHESMDENQRDYFLREQMKVISEELGEDENRGGGRGIPQENCRP